MKMARWFICSAGVLLLITALAKLVSSFGNERILLEREPIFGVQFRDLFRIVGMIELVAAFICFWSRRILFSSGIVAWLATCFLAYRFGVWRSGWHKPCSCLGNLTDMLHIQPQIADTAMKIILAYLLIGGYTTLLWLWWQRRQCGFRGSGGDI